MGELFADNWKVLPGLLAGAFISGIVVMIYMRDGIRKWLLNANGSIVKPCPLVEKGTTPMSKEEHAAICEAKWINHEKASQERWLHNQELNAKNRELLLAEIDHLKLGVDKIFEKLDRR